MDKLSRAHPVYHKTCAFLSLGFYNMVAYFTESHDLYLFFLAFLWMVGWCMWCFTISDTLLLLLHVQGINCNIIDVLSKMAKLTYLFELYCFNQ